MGGNPVAGFTLFSDQIEGVPPGESMVETNGHKAREVERDQEDLGKELANPGTEDRKEGLHSFFEGIRQERDSGEDGG